MTEKNLKEIPAFSNEFLAVWKKVDKNGNEYLVIKVFGKYFNVFQTPIRKNKD